ncbi:MAG: glycogen/starch synthase [Desulfoarculaceae bacterium]|nr:glycogen/starch synthase [Desulfoarculaceae bacterium]
MLTREYGNLAGAGGVKDVTLQLSKALAGWSGRSVSVVMPRYGCMDPVALGFAPLADPSFPERALDYEVDLDYAHVERREKVRVWVARRDRVTLYLLEADRFADKTAVYGYTTADELANPAHRAGQGHDDYFAMNILLQKGALDLMLLLDIRPDIIHCHDGHTAVLPAMIHENGGWRHFFRRTGTVVTIHNAGRGYHQEVADLSFAHAVTGLPWTVIMGNRLADCFDPLLAAARYAVMNTVSEQYGRELQETDNDQLTGWLGHTLQERGVILKGVTNGIDPSEFDPTDAGKSGIDAPFNPQAAGGLSGKRVCKEHLLRELAGDRSTQERLGGILPIGSLDFRPDLPLFTFIGRLNDQKGVGVLLAALRRLLKEQPDFQFLLLGSGGHDEEQGLTRLAEKVENRGRVCVLKGFNPALANRVYAAGDFFLIPSRYEPCGLTDFIAQLFGNLPIVHHVGGLVKVLDGETGFSYMQHTAAALIEAMQRAMALYQEHPARIRTMQRQAVQRIQEKHIWQIVMKQYLQLYKEAKDGNGQVFIDN